jgi:hypothetical protein
VSILTTQDNISLEKLVSLTSIPEDQLQAIVKIIPEDYGIKSEQDIVSFQKDNIKINIQPVLQIFYQISPEVGMQDQYGTPEQNDDAHKDDDSQDESSQDDN